MALFPTPCSPCIITLQRELSVIQKVITLDILYFRFIIKAYVFKTFYLTSCIEAKLMIPRHMSKFFIVAFLSRTEYLLCGQPIKKAFQLFPFEYFHCHDLGYEQDYMAYKIRSIVLLKFFYIIYECNTFTGMARFQNISKSCY